MDSNELEKIISVFERSQITSMNLKIEGMNLKLKKAPVFDPASPILSGSATQTDREEPSLKPASKNDSSVQMISSPLVGIFWASPRPEAEPYVSAGSQIQPGDTVCIIEAMKTMNEIKAQKSGRIVEVLVQNGDMVEYDQPIFLVEEET